MRRTVSYTAIIVLCILIGFWYVQTIKTSEHTEEQPIATVSYQCNGGRTIEAEYYKGKEVTSAPGEMPQPTGSVHVVLSDGRDMTLKQTISADGGRYSDGDPRVSGGETFVFWSKGNGALVLENNQEKSYIGCIRVAPQVDNLSEVYANGQDGFSIRYPANYILDDTYTYQNLGPGKSIGGIKFTIPASLTTNTNLGSDSYISVEIDPHNITCNAEPFLDAGDMIGERTETQNGVTYSIASTTGAGAGNRYEETVYALSGSNPCIALRYFIHYGVFELYSSNIHRFDHTALINQFDEIRRSLVIN